MSIIIRSKLSAFNRFFLSKGYNHEKIVSKNNYWKLSDEYRTFKKDEIVIIITLDYKENLININFRLVKIVNRNSIEFFTKKIGDYIYPDKDIPLANYDPIAKCTCKTIFRERIHFTKRNEISTLIDSQIAFLSENISDIEHALQFNG